MSQKHDLGHQKRRKNAEALKLQEVRRDARRGHYANNLVERRLAARTILDQPVRTKFDIKFDLGRDLKEARRRA